MKLIEGHWYKFDDRGEVHIGNYMGRQKGFECCVCNKGTKAHTFNIWYSHEGCENYETWGYGLCHIPTIIEDLGESEDVIFDWIV